MNQTTRSKRAAQIVHLLLSALSAGAGALAVLDPPTWPMLVLTIGVTEWGHLFAVPGAVASLPAWRKASGSRLGRGLGLLATGLALLSLARAQRLAKQLPGRLAAAFGEASTHTGAGAPARRAPLALADLLLGVRLPAIGARRLAYVRRGERALELDFYPPQGAGAPAPCLLVVHGGSWQGGDSSQLPALNRYLAARGYAVAAINYRLLPDHPFPAAYDDVLAAVGYLKQHAAGLGIDPHRLALLGRSAGGQLALLAAYAGGDPDIRAVVAFYAPTDMIEGHRNPAPKRVVDTVGVIERYLGGSPASARAAYLAAAPVCHAGPASPPTLLIHGGRDNMVSPRQSALLADRLAELGRPHMLLSLPWATHGCDANFSGPSGQLSTYAIERFLAATLA